jgi:hypothetical protein
MRNAYLAPMYRALIANRDRIDRFDDHGLRREHADSARNLKAVSRPGVT